MKLRIVLKIDMLASRLHDNDMLYVHGSNAPAPFATAYPLQMLVDWMWHQVLSALCMGAGKTQRKTVPPF